MHDVWRKYLSRKFLVALLGVVVVVATEWFGADQATVQAVGEKVVWMLGVFILGESAVDVARKVKGDDN